MIARRWIPLAAALLIALVAPLSTRSAEGENSSTLVGKISSVTETGVTGATVVAYHLSTGEVVRSSPTGPKGRFEMTGLKHGYYDLAIETAQGLFVANQVVNLPPGGKAVANLRLVTASIAGEGPRDFPGSDQPASGIAQLVKKGNKKIIGWAVAGGVGAALAIGGGGSGGGAASPSN